ncbi:hypothetical protein JW960_29320 [candidate division KSB1 bacterium]|nr:hypothetical protein [candidate division KSB1 bacterium]
MKKAWIIICLIPFAVAGVQAQPMSDDNAAMIEQQKALYAQLSNLLASSVDTCNQALMHGKQIFGFEPKLLDASQIDSLVAPGAIELQPPINETVVLLLLDRLKIRNESVNQMVHIISDQASYINFGTAAYEAQQARFDEAQKLADERFKKTETWGRKNFWRGIKYGSIAGSIVGLVVGLIIS